jgi:autotransporter-associated beta strand protein
MFRRLFPLLLPLLLTASGVLSAAPATLVQPVTRNGVTATMRLTKQDLRGAHFELWTQNAAGTYDVVTPVEERSYLGTVDEFPDAIASGIIQDDGKFRGAIYFDRGTTWFTLQNSVQFTRGDWQPSSFGFPSWTTRPGQAGTTMYGFDVGIDASYNYFNVRAGGNVARAFEYIEFSVAATRALYMQNILARPYLSRVIIRANQAQDPANGLGGGTYLEAVRNEWNNNQQSADRDVVAGLSAGSVGGGLAWVGVVGSNSAYSVNDSGGDGEFTIVWRHELGHNWGLGHYDGGYPEGGTINSDNQYARMCGPEASLALDHRNGRLNIFDNEGTYTTIPIPPYAAIDSAKFIQAVDSQVVINVVANDHDANGDSLSLISVAPVSANGGTLVRQGQKVIYQPRGNFVGTDSFTYKIQDSRGQTATGAVAVDVQSSDRLRLYMALNESLGTAITDSSVFRNTGLLTGTDLTTASVPGKFANAVNFDGVDDSISASGIKLNSNTVTLAAWIKPGAVQNVWSGIIFDRSSTVSGLSIGSAGELRYHWNDDKYNWNSNLVPAANVWTYVALVIEPGKATMYMNNGSGFQSAVNNSSHSPANFGTVNIGRDPMLTTRHFTGAIDEVRLYGTALTQAQLQTILDGGAADSPNPFNGASDVGPVNLSWAPSAVAVQYHVYLGTDLTAVQNATPASPEYQGAVATPQLTNPPTTELATNYWRVDTETASGTIPGAVWRFTRNGTGKVSINNFSFEDGPLGEGTPPAWTLTAGSAANLGTAAGASEGVQKLYIGPGVAIRQDLSHTLVTGETITLKYESSRNHPQRNIQLLAKNGGSYTLIAETTEATGSGAWPTITLNHTVTALHAGRQLAIRVISGNWNEFDNFRITTTATPVGLPNNAPTFTTDPISLPAATALVAYTGQSLASSATDLDSDSLTFSKLSGPAWLTVATDGTLSGTPAPGDTGLASFVIRASDPAGGMDFADLTIAVAEASFLYDTNGDTAGSGAAAGGTWDGSTRWTSDPAGTVATFAWVDGATAVFSTGSDAASDYTINNTANRSIGGFTARTGRPLVTGSALVPALAATPFIVEATALGARIDSQLTGTGGLVKSGPGLLMLGGNNRFTGNITINEGVLELAPAAKLYNSGFNGNAVLTVAAAATWRLPDYSYGGVGQLADTRQRRVINGGTIEVTGTNQTSGQDFTVTSAGGTFRHTAVGQTLTLAGNNNTNINTAGVLTFDTLGNISVTGVSAIIEGGGAVVKTGTGTLTLGNGGNSFSGDLTVTAGKLLATAASVTTNTALGAKSGIRTIAVNAPGSMDWTINNIFGGGGMTAASLPTIELNGTVLETTRFNAIGNVILDGASLVNSTAIIDPVTFDGFQFIGSVITNGTTPSSITTTNGRGNHLLGGGTTGFSVTDADGLLTVSTILRNGSTSDPGTASLRKTGPGTLSLTAANTYTGTTTVEAGTLVLGGSLASVTTIADTGTLSGEGSITAAVLVQAGGTLAPNSGATLTTGALTLASNSTLIADGLLAVSGNVDLTGAQITTTVIGPRVLLSYTGTRSGDFATITVPAGWEIEVDDTAQEIRLVAVGADGYEAWIDGFATAGQSDFNQDADNDGVSNGLEFLFGGDPTLAADTPTPTLVATPGGGFTYTFSRADRARGTTTVTAKLSDDLATWPSARDLAVLTDTEASSPGVTVTPQGDHDSISIQIPGGPSRTFLRLEVSAPAAP